MGQALMTFSSSTTANRLKKLAAAEGVGGVFLMQAPRSVSQYGCSYCLRFSQSNLPALLEIADQYHVNYRQVYKELTDETGRKMYQKL